MSRSLLLVAVVLLAGCSRGLPEREAELAALRKDEAHLAAQLTQLSKSVAALQSEVTAAQTGARSMALTLREKQLDAVARWKGQQAKLNELKKGVTLAPRLAAALDLAQSVAGGETVEKRFVRAAEAQDLATLQKLVPFWEERWLDVNGFGAPEEEDPTPVCPTTRSLGCVPIDSDSLWCPDAERNAGWALVLDQAQLTVAELSAGPMHVVDARLAPRVWLTRFGSPDNGGLFLHELRGGRFVTQWQARFNGEAGRLEQFKANLDEDPFTEALFWNSESLAFADPTSRDQVSVLRELQACDATALLERIPAPVRERCRALQAAAAAAAGDAGVR